MTEQLKIEGYKFRHSICFYAMLICGLAITISAGYGYVAKSHVTDLMRAFNEEVPDVSIFFLPTLFTAWYIGANFSNRTVQHDVITGHSRLSIIISRAIPCIFAGIVIQALEVTSLILTMGSKLGFDTFDMSLRNLAWIGTVVLQIAALECFLVFIGFLCCSLPVGIIATLITEFVMCNIMRNYVTQAWYKYSFFHLAESTETPVLIKSAVVAVISIPALIALAYLVFRKREI
ncbi:MAG: hypothetical protein J6U23_06495 [Clostridiales bacterium]|nr:hypothetical protein [Clostridiales bacterium]MBP5180082.1 hypothetical protein [Clostridiales bacterium]